MCVCVSVCLSVPEYKYVYAASVCVLFEKGALSVLFHSPYYRYFTINISFSISYTIIISICIIIINTFVVIDAYHYCCHSYYYKTIIVTLLISLVLSTLL